MNTPDDYLDGLEDIAIILDDLDNDELWDRYLFTANALALQLDIEIEVISSEVK